MQLTGTWRRIFSCARAAFSASFLSTTPAAVALALWACAAGATDGDGDGGGTDEATERTLSARPPALLPLPRPAPPPGGGGGAFMPSFKDSARVDLGPLPEGPGALLRQHAPLPHQDLHVAVCLSSHPRRPVVAGRVKFPVDPGIFERTDFDVFLF
jgi:hypothetical protein